MLRGYVGTDLDAAHANDQADRVPVHRRAAHRGAGAQPRRGRSSTPSRPTATGNVQIWGLVGVQKEAVLAASRSIVTVEEIVDELEPRARTRRAADLGGRPPCARCPAGAHPSFAMGYSVRDNAFYKSWDEHQPGPRRVHGLDRRSTSWARPTSPSTGAASGRPTGGGRPWLTRGSRADDLMIVNAARCLGELAAAGSGLLRRHRAAVDRGQPGPPAARTRTAC